MDEGQTLRSMMRDDAYRVVRVLADGPSGRTELVMLDGDGPLVRKRIPLELANAAAWAALINLDEPHLPHIESIYQTPDELVVVYDYVDGVSACDLVASHGALAPTQACAIIGDVCQAAEALHERGVVHRDITPANTIVAADGAHLVDMGIARQHVSGRERDTTTLGTWGYAAPEQYGFAQTDERSDVYSLGRVLGFLLTGEEPDQKGYAEALEDPQRVDPTLAAVVRRATAFEPSARYQSAAQLREAVCGLGPADVFASSESDWAAPRQEKPSTGAGPQVPASQPARQPGTVQRRRREVRPFFQAPAVAWGCAVVTMVVLGLWVALLAWVWFESLRGNVSSWGPPQHLMALVLIAGTGIAACEIYRAVTLRSPYDVAPSVLIRLLARLMALVVATFLLALVCGMVVSLALGSPKTSAK